tara:strand:+ start:1966 stop:3558 length:1593 start_codon:yes stop_codon:yes gene_type:complete
MKNKNAEMLVSRFSTLRTNRSTWESHWQEIADYMLPRKADITTQRTRGDKRNEVIFDGTAIHALELLSSSLHGMLTNSATPWFTLAYKDAALSEDDEAREWLDSVTQDMYVAFNRSNFQQEIQELYQDLISFGTSAMFVSADEKNLIRFNTRHIKEIYIAENEKGQVDTVFRHFSISARAAVNLFGEDNVGPGILNKFKKNIDADVSLLHVVMPRDTYDASKEDAANMPFKSCYLDPDDVHMINESGFREFPYVVPRYLKASYEIYGRSPSMNALPDVKMLNKMSEVAIKAGQKQIDPPLMVPDDGFMLPIRTVPGGLNFYRAGSRDRIEPLNIGANNPITVNMIQDRQLAVQKTFYVDQLLMAQGGNMTATEVLQRNEEKMRLLGPVLGRLQSELLQPLIERVFNILERQGVFRPAPEILMEQTIDIEYVSPLAKAQKSGDLNSVMRGIEIFGSMSQFAPVLDYLDADGLVKYVQKMLGLPAAIIKSDQEVAQVRQQRQQQEQAAMEDQAIAEAAQSAGAAAPMIKAVE